MSDITFQAYLSKMQRARDDLPQVVAKACREATIRAVDAATDATPPHKKTGRKLGKNVAVGKLAQRWAVASTTEPEISGGTITTVLANDAQYASYVNDGHRMDRHFVPGLYIDGKRGGVLSYEPSGIVDGEKVGIVVGTKTKYVKGEFMTDKAKKAYQETLEAELDAKVKELFT